MTVYAAEPGAVTINGTGETTYDLPFDVDGGHELEVWVREANGVRRALSYPLDYSVVINRGATAPSKIVFTAPLELGAQAYIARRPEASQDLSLPTYGRFRAEDIEHALDRLIWHVKDLRERLSRIPTVNPMVQERDFRLLDPIPGYVLMWSGDRRTLAAVPMPSGGSGGGGSAVLGVDMVSVYGADPTGVAPVDDAIAAATAAGERVLLFRPGTYRVSDTIALPAGTSIIGSGRHATTFRADAGNALMFSLLPNTTEGEEQNWNDCLIAACRLEMAQSGIYGIGHRSKVIDVQFAGGTPAGWCIDFRASNEFYIDNVEGGFSGGPHTLRANGIRIRAEDNTLADLQASGEEWIGNGLIGERDINFGDGYIGRVRLRIRPADTGVFGFWIGHNSTKMPSRGETGPGGNAVAGVINNTVLEACQVQFEDTADADTSTAYHFRRVQRLTLVCLNGERSGTPFVFESDADTPLGPEACKHNVMIGCQGFNVRTRDGVKLGGHNEPPMILGGQHMAPWGAPYTPQLTMGDDSADATINISPRDTLLQGQLWLKDTATGHIRALLRVPGGYQPTLAEGSFAGDGSTTVFDLAIPVTEAVLGSHIDVALNPDYDPSLVEGTDYTWQLVATSERYDTIRITMTTAPASGETLYVRYRPGQSVERIYLAGLQQDTGRSDGWNNYWSSHPKNFAPTHALQVYLGGLNEVIISRAIGKDARQDARLELGNGPDRSAPVGWNGPLAYVQVRDPLRLLPWSRLPADIYDGQVFQPVDRACFPDTFQYWRGAGPYIQRDDRRDGAANPVWEWFPLAQKPGLVGFVEVNGDRTLERHDFGRTLWFSRNAGTQMTLTVPGDLARADECGVEGFVGTTQYKTGFEFWVLNQFEFGDPANTPGDDVVIQAGTGCTLKSADGASTVTLSFGQLAWCRYWRTGDGTAYLFVKKL